MSDDASRASVSKDAVDRLLEAIDHVSGSVRGLEKTIGAHSVELKIVTNALRESGKEQVMASQRMDRLTERVEVVERNIRRHDSGFHQASEVDAKHASELSAVIIAVDETRKLAKDAIGKLESLEGEQKKSVDATEAQNPMLAKLDGQTKQMTLPMKVAAAFNALISVLYLIHEIAKVLRP